MGCSRTVRDAFVALVFPDGQPVVVVVEPSEPPTVMSIGEERSDVTLPSTWRTEATSW